MVVGSFFSFMYTLLEVKEAGFESSASSQRPILLSCCSSILKTVSKSVSPRQWHPTPVLLPGKSHGQRSLVGCSPRGRWGSDMTERLQCQCTIALHALLSMEFSMQEYWSGLPFPTPWDHHKTRIELVSLASPALAGGFFTTAPPS